MSTGEYFLNNATVGTFIRDGVIYSNRPRMIEKVLWTNSSPTSSFADQTITLSDSIDNYTSLAVTFKLSTTEGMIYTTKLSVEDFKKCTNPATILNPASYAKISSVLYARRFYYASDTTIYFATSYRVNASGSDNTANIPIQISGVKEEHVSTENETVLWTNPSPTATFAGKNVTLSDSINNYKYIKFTWKTTTTDTTSSSAYVLSSDLASMTNSNGSRFLSLSSLWTNVYSRNITYNSATSVSIATSTRQGASGSNNGVNIPLEILGINELAHGTIKTDSGLLPYSLTESVKVTLGYKPSYVEIKRYIDSTHWATDTYDANLSSVKQLVGASNGSTKIDTEYSVPTTTPNMIASIDDDGFTVTAFQSAAITTYGTPYFRAIGS